MQLLLELPMETVYEISPFLSLQDCFSLYISRKEFYKQIKNKIVIKDSTLKYIISSNALLTQSNVNYSKHMREVFSKHFYSYIPMQVDSIYTYLKWIKVFVECQNYYNISFFQNNIILFTSKGRNNIFTICKKIQDKLNKIVNYNYIYNKPFGVLISLAKERNINALSKNWYHQLEFRQLAELAYEITSTI